MTHKLLIAVFIMGLNSTLDAQPNPENAVSAAVVAKQKPEFRADKVPVLVEVDVMFAEWTGSDDASKNASSELAGNTADVVQRVTAMEKKGELAVIQHVRMSTIDEFSSFVSIAERRPRVASATATVRGMSNSVVLDNVGMLVTITPHVHAGDLVTLEINFEKSGPGKTYGPLLAESPMGEKVRAEIIGTFVIQTAVRLAHGKTALVAGLDGKENRNVVLVSVKFVK